MVPGGWSVLCRYVPSHAAGVGAKVGADRPPSFFLTSIGRYFEVQVIRHYLDNQWKSFRSSGAAFDWGAASEELAADIVFVSTRIVICYAVAS